MLFSNLKNADHQMENRRTNIFAVLIVVFEIYGRNNYQKYSVKTFQFNSMFSLRKIPCGA